MLFRKIKKIIACLGLVAIMACSIFVPAFATSDAVGIEPFTIDSNFFRVESDFIFVEGCNCYSYYLPVGRYLISFEGLSENIESDLESEHGFQLPYVVCDVNDGFSKSFIAASPIMLEVTEDMVYDDTAPDFMRGFCVVVVNSVSLPSVVDVSPENSVVGSILGIWSSILGWFASAFTEITPLFYSSGTGLTFIGFLAVAGMAISVAFLLFFMIKRWLRLGS